MAVDSNNLGKILKRRRLTVALTLTELGRAAGVSSSHLYCIEKGKRFPSARTLRKIAGPLGVDEAELLTYAGFLSPQPSADIESKAHLGQLDPYVAAVLSEEPVEVQRTVLGICCILKSIAGGRD